MKQFALLTDALSRTLMVDESAISSFTNALSKVQSGSFSQFPKTTRSMSLKDTIINYSGTYFNRDLCTTDTSIQQTCVPKFTYSH